MRAMRLLLWLAAMLMGCLAVVAAASLLLLGTGAAIRTLVPDLPQQQANATILEQAVQWSRGLRQPAWVEEENAAREVNQAVREWFEKCRLVTFRVENGEERLASADPLYWRIRPTAVGAFDKRRTLARIADDSFTLLEIGTVLGIIAGFAATVFAGLRSDTATVAGAERTIRVLAILFPALGTAIAAVTAFYSPRDQLLKVSQGLLPLQQFHERMRTELLQCDCPKTDKAREALSQRMDRWADALARLSPETTALRLARAAQQNDKAGGQGTNPAGNLPSSPATPPTPVR